jgi:quinolinate synthase
VYINTSLITKARAHAMVPTITCTSSNVVKTVLQAFAQVPDVRVWFGPDTYMGKNLAQLFSSLAELPEEQIRALHPDHNRSSIARVAERFHYFEQGTCIVHHMFGADVAERVRRDYADAFVTAHLEVPGEMFEVALEKQRRGQGVVGSTSDILGFIANKVDEAVGAGKPARLPFVLGTEAGMITSIVRRVRSSLRAHQEAGGPEIVVDIVFPVASEAIATTGDAELAVVPGVAGGEGCSTAGGCATCPYMKMNSLDALLELVGRVAVAGKVSLAPFEPRKYAEQVAGHTAAEMGGRPILHMRHFQHTGRFSDELAADIRGRHEGRPAAQP